MRIMNYRAETMLVQVRRRGLTARPAESEKREAETDVSNEVAKGSLSATRQCRNKILDRSVCCEKARESTTYRVQVRTKASMAGCKEKKARETGPKVRKDGRESPWIM